MPVREAQLVTNRRDLRRNGGGPQGREEVMAGREQSPDLLRANRGQPPLLSVEAAGTIDRRGEGRDQGRPLPRMGFALHRGE